MAVMLPMAPSHGDTAGSPQDTPRVTDLAESSGVAVEGMEVKSNCNCVCDSQGLSQH